MNIIELQEELEYWPDQKIHEEVMRPTGAANGQTYLVVLEAERRNKERQAYQAALATQQQPKPTVVQETMMEFGGGQPMGGVPDVDPNMMQNQMMAQQMPQQQMPQQMPQGQPMAMKAGGAIPSRYQFGEQIDPRLIGQELEGGLVIEDEEQDRSGILGLGGVGEGGWFYDYTDPVDNALLALSAVPIGGRALSGLGLTAKAGYKGLAPLIKLASKGGFPFKFGEKASIPATEAMKQLLGKGRLWKTGLPFGQKMKNLGKFATNPYTLASAFTGKKILENLGGAEAGAVEMSPDQQEIFNKYLAEQEKKEAVKSKDQDRYSYLSEQLEKTIRSPEERRSALQGAALAQIGAGIAGGDVAGGLANAAAMVSKTQALEDEQAARAYGTLLEAETTRERTVSIAQEKKITLQLSLLTAMMEAGVVMSDPKAVKAFYASLPEGIQAYLATGEGRDFTANMPQTKEELDAFVKNLTKSA